MTYWLILSIICNLPCLQPGCEGKKSGMQLQVNNKPIMPAADRTEVYVPLLKGKRTAIFANHTSLVGKTHLVDTLLSLGISISCIFSPEHGFRGDADAGEKVKSGKDPKTGLKLVSLYGERKKPTAEDLKQIDVIVFDVQDVGARFYTYISSLQYLMEAALENNVPLVILDRPNPNGWYIDGPVLDKKFRSFVGMQPVPVVYGMTIGEYALMLAGEGWLSEKANAAWKKASATKSESEKLLKVITCRNYDHSSRYSLPVAPSPNLRDMQAVYIYPSTCFFEGTIISEGRGTDKPFLLIGHPDLPKHLVSFTPKPNRGAKTSKCFYQTCYGWDLSGTKEEVLKKIDGKVRINFVQEAYRLFPGKDSFFIVSNFNQKAGNDILIRQIKEGMSEEDIRSSWQPGLEAFKKIRKKYLLYKDF